MENKLEMKNVVFLITGLGHGGAETQLVRVSRELKRRGWEVTIVTMIDPASKALIALLEDAQISLHSLGMTGLSSLRAMPKFLRILKKEKPYVLCSFLYHANIFGLFASKLADIPRFVTSIRDDRFGNPKRIKLAKFFHQFDDCTTVNSGIVAKQMVNNDIISSEKLRVANNTIEVNSFVKVPTIQTQLRKELGIRKGDFVYVAVGCIAERKDYGVLVEASRELPKNIKVFIVGKLDDGSLAKDIEKKKLGEVIQLIGYRKNVPDFLSIADALVLSSKAEGLPNVVIEAHAGGLPVVATRAGGVAEIVQDEETGFIVPTKNPKALHLAMIRMAKLSPKVRQEMGRKGREHVKNSFGLEPIVDLWESILLNK